MSARWSALPLALVLLGAVVSGCADSAATTDAAARDTTAPNDLAADVEDASLSDLGRDATLDAPTADRFDAGTDVALDGARDAAADRTDGRTAWGDATLVDVSGILIPLDPNAVPAPGSECTSDASVRPGDPTVAPPRPIRPLSVSRVTSQRPTFQWVLPEGTTGARVEVCADRCCTRVLQTFDADGTTTRPMTPLPPGVVFWRMFGRRGTVMGSRASYTWEFGVRRRDAPNDTTWGTIRDFNGDGMDDVMMFRPLSRGAASRELVLVPGAIGGFRELVATEVVTVSGGFAVVGDLNGDGMADLAWNDSGRSLPLRTWYSIVLGARGRPLSERRLDVRPLGDCAQAWSAAVVDWNGDGYSDLMLAVASRCDLLDHPGDSFLVGYQGSAAGIASVPQWAFRLDSHFYFPQVDVSQGPGSVDVDRDGYGDVIVTSHFVGSGTTDVPSEHAVIHGGGEREPMIDRVVEPFLGVRARGFTWDLGDLDGDGYGDFGVLSPLSGSVPVFSPMRGWNSPVVTLIDPLMGTHFGSYLSSGDVNADGLSDVIASSETALIRDQDSAVVNMGRVYVFFGPVGPGRGPVWIERSIASMGSLAATIFGSGSMSPGDVNADGVDDVVMINDDGDGLCQRFGRVGLSSGPPDGCLNDIAPPGAEIF